MNLIKIIFLLLLICIVKCSKSHKKENNLIRPASHLGSWYHNSPELLSQEINQYISNSKKLKNNGYAKSIIVPHAGYRFSGPTMAQSYININPDNYNRVVILGPSHHSYFQGCGLTSFEKFATPFGEINVDIKYIKKLLTKKDIFFEVDKSIDINEHSIEMELTFLKYIFNQKDFSIIPIIVGDNNYETNKKIAEMLYELYKDKNTLFVISSDFCHWGRNFRYTYYNKNFENIWESIQDLDKQALDIIEEINSEKLEKYFKKTKNTICGRNPISISLLIIELYKKNHSNEKVKFIKAGYAQSNKVKSIYETSVSYAAAVNYI